MPTISVVMPVCNAMPYLPEALKSLLEQDCDDFEIVVLDDASTDGSAEYLDGIDDSRLRVLHCPKQGLTKLLNVGLREARGSLVARMDADDVSAPHRLSVQRSFMEANADAVVLGCQSEVIDLGGRSQGIWEFPAEDVATKLLLFRNQTPFVHPGVMFRRDVAMAVGGYDESLPYCQDRDLWWKLAHRGRFHNHPEFLIRYRRHANSISTSKYAEQVRLANEITTKYSTLYGIDSTKLPCFQRVEELVRSHRPEYLPMRGVLTYVTVLNRVLAVAAQRWGAKDVEIRRIRRERWRFLALGICMRMRPDRLVRSVVGRIGKLDHPLGTGKDR